MIYFVRWHGSGALHAGSVLILYYRVMDFVRWQEKQGFLRRECTRFSRCDAGSYE